MYRLCESELYNPEKIFCVPNKKYTNYVEKYFDDFIRFDNIIIEYIAEHVEYLLEWMKALYVDVQLLQNITEQIYNECIPELPKNKAWMEPCIKVDIYMNAEILIDKALKARTMSVLNI